MDTPSLTFPLSTTARQLQRSVMRDLIALAAQPEIVSFAGGLPAADCLPLDEIATCLEAVLTSEGRRALQYGPPYRPLREWIAGFMRRRGVACTVENVFITNGAQQALEILGRLLLDPGEAAVVEALTFTGISQVMHAHGARLRAAALDLRTGVDPADFERALTAGGQPARVGAVIPDFNNPTSASLPTASRVALAAAAARTGVPLIEDDPYALLRYAGEVQPPIKAYDEAGLVLYIGSFSKIIAPALRLGWIVAPAELLPRLTVLRESLDLESSQLLQRVATEFVQRGFLETHVQVLNTANLERRNAMLAALGRELGDTATWTVPDGGLFLWLTLPPQVDTAALFPAALANKVAYIPGVHFSAEGAFGSALRLNYSNATPERIAEGVHRLAAVIRTAMA
jgi:2-aminoadipate transaminase